MGRLAPLLLAFTAALAITGKASADTTIAEPPRATPVDADAGLLVWSTYEDGAYHLTVLRDGEVERLPVAPHLRPFDADAGTDAAGRPALVFTRCATREGTSCDVKRYSFRTRRETPAADAAHANIDERHPTLDRGRVAWVRTGRSVRLRAGGRTRILPGVPRGTRYGGVDALELSGDHLAQVTFSTSLGEDRTTTDVRLVAVRRGTSRHLLRSGTGESGQTFLDPSIDGAHLYTYKTCVGDPSGCGPRGAGAFRASLRSGLLALAGSGHQLSGFSVDGGDRYDSEGAEGELCELEQDYTGLPGADPGPCAIVRRDPAPRFRPYRR